MDKFKFEKYHTAMDYLVDRYFLNRIVDKPMNSLFQNLFKKNRNIIYQKRAGTIPLTTLDEMKKDLIETHTLSEIGTLKAQITAHLERYKQITIVISVLVFLGSTFFTVVNNANTVTQQTENIFNNLEEYNKTDQQIAQVDNLSHYRDILIYFFIAVVFLVLIIVLVFLRKYVWINSLKNILDETYEEKKEKDVEEN